jgi:hypothetical protein
MNLHTQDKNRIIERLKEAGWDMAPGAVTLDRAALIYDNSNMAIEVTQDHELRELLLTLTTPEGGELTVFPAYGDHLEETLNAIVGFQDRINAENFHDMLRELVAACPEVYFQEGEDDEARLLTPE